MIKFFYGFLLFLPLITTAQTIDQALSNGYFYQVATVSSILFVLKNTQNIVNNLEQVRLWD